jgi:hypothetical protein
MALWPFPLQSSPLRYLASPLARHKHLVWKHSSRDHLRSNNNTLAVIFDCRARAGGGRAQHFPQTSSTLRGLCVADQRAAYTTGFVQCDQVQRINWWVNHSPTLTLEGNQTPNNTPISVASDVERYARHLVSRTQFLHGSACVACAWTQVSFLPVFGLGTNIL